MGRREGRRGGRKGGKEKEGEDGEINCDSLEKACHYMYMYVVLT